MIAVATTGAGRGWSQPLIPMRAGGLAGWQEHIPRDTRGGAMSGLLWWGLVELWRAFA